MLICGCKNALPVVMGTKYCARCTVEMILSGGTTCLSKLEQERNRRERQERELWNEYEREQENGDVMTEDAGQSSVQRERIEQPQRKHGVNRRTK